MTEEVKPDASPELKLEVKPDVEAPQSDAPQYTVLETEMMTQGWKPKDQFDGDEEEFVTAAEFKRRGELFRKISDTNRRLDRATNALTALQQHQKKLYEAGYTKALEDLHAQHAVAVEEGDSKAAAQIVKQIATTTEQAVQARQVQVAPAEPPAVMTEFLEKNSSWYQKDDVMTAYADAEGFKFAQAELRAGRQATVEGVLNHVTTKVREKFPSQLGGKRSAMPPAVGPASSPTRMPVRKPNFTRDDLSDLEKQVMKGFASEGVMTEEEYMNDIKKMRGIK